MHGWVLRGSPTKGVPYWEGLHAIPRVLKLENDQLVQTRIRELAMLCGQHVQMPGRTIAPSACVPLKEVRDDALRTWQSMTGDKKSFFRTPTLRNSAFRVKQNQGTGCCGCNSRA
jgi:sucrose-6-phosphate hydrolase SacC (GH32 family)